MIYYNRDRQVFQSSLFDGRFCAGFGTKQNGNAKNLNQTWHYFDEQQGDFRHIVFLKQVHSDRSCYVSRVTEPLTVILDTDAAVTKLNKTVFVVKTADCLPLIYADAANGIIGISHNGWRGTAKKISHRVIDLFIRHGSRPDQITVVIGPGINQCCYEIGDELYQHFHHHYGKYAGQIFRRDQGKTYLNLLRLNYLLLLEKQILPQRIDYFPFCTSCDARRFYSFRRGNRRSFGEMFSYVSRP
ncbi:peptidoglycan editing factor PgeF [Patescibacteria group bacterium]|nr:peptidoglycan editing factor PgeF [Patescibacteria group bacterium]MCL5091765.1 peptidoglycan editing factor PgeF [Patescibacteria group bacterium]